MQGKDGHQSLTGKWVLPRHWICQLLDLGLPAARAMRSKCLSCLSYQAWWWFVWVAQITSFVPIHFIRGFSDHGISDVFQARRGLGYTSTHKWYFWSRDSIKKSGTPLNRDSQQTLLALCARLCFCVLFPHDAMRFCHLFPKPSAPLWVTKSVHPRITCVNQHSHGFPHQMNSFCYHKYL